jgi:hypothetical protein
VCQIKSLVLACSACSRSMLNKVWRHHSQEMIKFVYLFSKSYELRKNSNLTVLNMGSKLDIRQPKQEVFWRLTYSRPEHTACSGWRKAQSGNVMDMTRCRLGKFSVVPTFVTRRLHICKDARDPSGETTEVWRYGFQHFHFVRLTGFFTEWLYVKRFEVD